MIYVHGSPPPAVTPLTREAALDVVALTAKLLFVNGQTTERTVVAAEQLGHTLGLPVRVLPYWGELTVEIDHTSSLEIVPAKPLGVDMGKVLAVMTIVDRVCCERLSPGGIASELAAAERLPPVSTLRFTLFAAIGAAALGVIFGAPDTASVLLIAASASLGALFRRWLATFGGHPFIQPLCAAVIAGAVAAAAGRLHLSDARSLVAFCPCMVLVPGPHILNGAIDLARTRIALGIARLTYGSLIILMICIGLLLGGAAGGASLPGEGSSVPVPFVADMMAAGCAVAAFGTFFSIPWRLLPLPIAVGMLAHAARWALISLAGAHVATGALIACILVGVIVTPVVDRLHLPFAAVGFSAVVSMMPGVFLFRAASASVELIAIGERAPTKLLASIFANSATAFLIILAINFGLILPRMLFERSLSARVQDR
jgi:uncharacterized membrane protein YjjP (DUF1212 family)